MRRLFPAAALVAAALLVSACGTWGPTGQQQLDIAGDDVARASGAEASYSPFNWSPPNYAGMTAGRIVMDDQGRPQVVEFLSGKEAEDATIVFDGTEGRKVTYSAKGLRGFEGQLARAQVERDLAAELGELWQNATPEIRGGLVDAVCLVVTKAPCG